MSTPIISANGRKGRIAVTPRSISDGGHPALRQLEMAGYDVVYPAPGAVPSERQLRKDLPGCVGYIAGTETLSGPLLAEFRELKAISRNGVGVDSIDVEAAKRLGISILTAPGANSQGVAELTIALILASIRSIPWHDGQLKAGQWNRRPGRELAGRVLGLIGCGQIGRRVAGMALGLGMKVLAFDEYPMASFNPSRTSRGRRWRPCFHQATSFRCMSRRRTSPSSVRSPSVSSRKGLRSSIRRGHRSSTTTRSWRR